MKFVQHAKMWANYNRRGTAASKASEIEAENYEIHKANLNKWNEYREKKIQLIAIFIQVLKRKNFLRRWLRLQKSNQVFSKVVQNLFIRREFNRIKEKRNFVHIRFLVAYKFQFRKQWGLSMDFRRQNEIRRSLNFGAVTRF